MQVKFLKEVLTALIYTKMQHIPDLLNKIKWDKKEKPEQYEIFYLDRITKKLIGIKFKDIKRIEGSFMVLEKNNEEVNVPLHRIKRVERKGKLVWGRKSLTKNQ